MMRCCKSHQTPSLEASLACYSGTNALILHTFHNKLHAHDTRHFFKIYFKIKLVNKKQSSKSLSGDGTRNVPRMDLTSDDSGSFPNIFINICYSCTLRFHFHSVEHYLSSKLTSSNVKYRFVRLLTAIFILYPFSLS